MTQQDSVATDGATGTVKDSSGSGKAPVAPRQAAPAVGFKATLTRQKWLLLPALVVVGVLAYLGWKFLQPAKLPAGFASSNGRIEATQIDIATKLAGRIKKILKDEGDVVAEGDEVAYMDRESLEAQLREARAKHREAISGVVTAKKMVDQRKSEKAAADAMVAQRKGELALAKNNVARGEELVEKGISKEELETRRTNLSSAEAALRKAEADVAAAEAAIATAESFVIRSEASVDAALATIDRIQADINDSKLTAPRDGRVQYRIAQAGEVLNAGGKVLNMIDLNDVYMTFFLPTDWAGRVKLGAEARIVLDAAPQFVIPAKVTFIADVAQFTPKTVETAEERQKLTFRIKAHIDKKVLEKYVRDVKTGLPGMAYVRLDPQAQWPAHLQVKLPE